MPTPPQTSQEYQEHLPVQLVDSRGATVGETTVRPAAQSVLGAFTYRTEAPESGHVEHENDHVLVGHYDGDLPSPSLDEASDLAWYSLPELAATLDIGDSGSFTPWLPGVVREVLAVRGEGA